MDVRRFFTADTVELLREESIGFYRFSNALPGDGEFYRKLMTSIPYEAGDKPEFRRAASWLPAGASVLDVGCGLGRFSSYCGSGYKGIDLNPEAAKVAQAAGRPVFEADLADQPSGQFDVVTLFQMLEHVSDPVAYARMAVRCLKPGGLLIISVPDKDGTFGAAVNQFLNYPPHHLSWWGEAALRGLMAELDLETAQVWREPLRPEHFQVLLFALMYPRRARHFDFSLASLFCRVCAELLAWILPRRECPFVLGHTIMVAGRKAEGAA